MMYMNEGSQVKGSWKDRQKAWRLARKKKKLKEQEFLLEQKKKGEKHYNKLQVFFHTLFGLFIGIFENMADHSLQKNHTTKVQIKLEKSEKKEFQEIKQMIEKVEQLTVEHKSSPRDKRAIFEQLETDWNRLKVHPDVSRQTDIIRYAEEKLQVARTVAMAEYQTVCIQKSSSLKEEKTKISFAEPILAIEKNNLDGKELVEPSINQNEVPHFEKRETTDHLGIQPTKTDDSEEILMIDEVETEQSPKIIEGVSIEEENVIFFEKNKLKKIEQKINEIEKKIPTIDYYNSLYELEYQLHTLQTELRALRGQYESYLKGETPTLEVVQILEEMNEQYDHGKKLDMLEKKIELAKKNIHLQKEQLLVKAQKKIWMKKRNRKKKEKKKKFLLKKKKTRSNKQLKRYLLLLT